MRAYGKICLTTHAPFGALHLSDPAFFGCRHPLDVPRSANRNKRLQKRLRGEHEAVQMSEHSHSLYENARCTFNRSTHGFKPGPTMHISVACRRKATLKLTLALAGAKLFGVYKRILGTGNIYFSIANERRHTAMVLSSPQFY